VTDLRPPPELAPFDEPACATCRKRAACIGVYEDGAALASFACNACCAHGNEDGHCRPLTDEDRRDVKRAARLINAALEAVCEQALDYRIPLESLREQLTAFYEDFRANREAHARHARETDTET
jgi:hypothetical protein